MSPSKCDIYLNNSDHKYTHTHIHIYIYIYICPVRGKYRPSAANMFICKKILKIILYE